MIRTPKIERDSHDLEALRTELPQLIGSFVAFSNGCVICLQEEAGSFWGDSPYGELFGIEADKDWVEKLIKTLAYWNEPRNEKGLLIQQTVGDDAR